MLLWLMIVICFPLQTLSIRVLNLSHFPLYLSSLAIIWETTTLFLLVFRHSAFTRFTIISGGSSSDRSFVPVWTTFKLESKCLLVGLTQFLMSVAFAEESGRSFAIYFRLIDPVKKNSKNFLCWCDYPRLISSLSI